MLIHNGHHSQRQRLRLIRKILAVRWSCNNQERGQTSNDEKQA